MAGGLGPKLPQLLGVVGAGQMGAGIAQVAASKGLSVVLTDVNPAVLERGLAVIRKSLARQVKKSLTTPEEADQTASRIVTASSLKVSQLLAAHTIKLDNESLSQTLQSLLSCRPWRKLTLSLRP